MLYPANLYFKNKGKINGFPDKQKLRVIVASRPDLSIEGISTGSKQVTTDNDFNLNKIKQNIALVKTIM